MITASRKRRTKRNDLGCHSGLPPVSTVSSGDALKSCGWRGACRGLGAPARTGGFLAAAGPLLSRLLFVPIGVERPAGAIEASRPAPAMAAAGTSPARHKCVPAGAAGAGEIFRIIARGAKPAVRRFGSPLAARAADAAKIRRLRLPAEPLSKLAGYSRVVLQ